MSNILYGIRYSYKGVTLHKDNGNAMDSREKGKCYALTFAKCTEFLSNVWTLGLIL